MQSISFASGGDTVSPTHPSPSLAAIPWGQWGQGATLWQVGLSPSQHPWPCHPHGGRTQDLSCPCAPRTPRTTSPMSPRTPSTREVMLAPVPRSYGEEEGGDEGWRRGSLLGLETAPSGPRGVMGAWRKMLEPSVHSLPHPGVLRGAGPECHQHSGTGLRAALQAVPAQPPQGGGTPGQVGGWGLSVHSLRRESGPSRVSPACLSPLQGTGCGGVSLGGG